MSDVILYKKQKEQLAKATGKTIEALNGLTLVLSQIGVTPVGKPEKPTAEAPTKKKAGRKSKAEGKQPVAKNGGSAFAEM